MCNNESMEGMLLRNNQGFALINQVKRLQNTMQVPQWNLVIAQIKNQVKSLQLAKVDAIEETCLAT